MAHITILGLGPGSPEHLTREAWAVLEEANELWLRTAHHPVVSGLPAALRVQAFDEIYEKAETFEQVYAQIAEEVVALGQSEQGVVYGVPGHPLVGEASVLQVLNLARKAAVPVHIVAGLSFIEPVLAALELDALDGLQVCDALEITLFNHPPLMPDVPALIAQVYSRVVASDLKLVLMNQYPDEYPVSLVDAAGIPGQSVQAMALYEIDRCDVGPLTSLYLPAMSKVSSFEGFQETVARLRSPEGCPWDREQTHKSLRRNLLEEAYEVMAAIEAEDSAELCEELGDLLLQIVLHAQIATELGEFQMPDVIAGIDAKIKYRHPHVWGDVAVDNVEDVLRNWEALKRVERNSDVEKEPSALASVPITLPALAQAYAYRSRAAHVGLEQQSGVADLWTSVQAKIESLKSLSDFEKGSSELGALLFALVEGARRLEIDPESALREANARFAQRFQDLEDAAREQQISLEQLPQAELVRLWYE